MLKICTRLWRKAHAEVKMLKNWRVWTTFVSSDVEKMHAAVAKSTFGSENVKKLTSSEHFLKFWCRKLWSNSEVKMYKMYKTWRVWTTSVRAHVEKVHAAVAKSTFGSEIVQNMRCSNHLDLHRVSTHMVCLTKEKKELKLKGAAVATVVGIVVKLLLLLLLQIS